MKIIKIKPNKYYKEEFEFGIYYMKTDDSNVYDMGWYNKVSKHGIIHHIPKPYYSINDLNILMYNLKMDKYAVKRTVIELPETGFMGDMVLELL